MAWQGGVTSVPMCSHRSLSLPSQKEIVMKLSEKAVIARINRKLAHTEQKLHKSRRWDSDIRNYYIIGWRFNTLVASYDSLEQVAKDIGVLEDNETLDN